MSRTPLSRWHLEVGVLSGSRSDSNVKMDVVAQSKSSDPAIKLMKTDHIFFLHIMTFCFTCNAISPIKLHWVDIF